MSDSFFTSSLYLIGGTMNMERRKSNKKLIICFVLPLKMIYDMSNMIYCDILFAETDKYCTVSTW